MAGVARAVITRHLRARPEQVWEACTDPKLLASWFGPKAFDVCEVEADVRVGGRFAFRMTSAQGTYGANGVYREVTPPSRLVLTWTWTEAPDDEPLDGVESLVTFELRPAGQGTMLTLTHDRLADQASAESHCHGWTEAVDKLERLFASRTHEVVTTVRMAAETEIRRIIQSHAAAVLRGDIDSMLADVADDVVMFDVVEPLRRIGRAPARARAAEWVGSYDGSISWANRDIAIVADEAVGFASMLSRVTGTLKTGDRVDMWFRKTLGLQKRDERWLIVHDHGSAPFNPETGGAALGLEP